MYICKMVGRWFSWKDQCCLYEPSFHPCNSCKNQLSFNRIYLTRKWKFVKCDFPRCDKPLCFPTLPSFHQVISAAGLLPSATQCNAWLLPAEIEPGKPWSDQVWMNQKFIQFLTFLLHIHCMCNTHCVCVLCMNYEFLPHQRLFYICANGSKPLKCQNSPPGSLSVKLSIRMGAGR